MQTGLKRVIELQRADAVKMKKRKLIAFLIVFVLFCFMMCLRTVELGFVPPLQVVKNIFTWIMLSAARILHWSVYDQRYGIIMAHPYYLETIGRLQGIVVSMLLGAVLSIAGAVFQNVFRNPIATPSMLGVASGIEAGNLILILKYSTAAATMLTTRYIVCYGCSLLLLGIIFVTGKLMGNRKSSVTDILLSGTVVMRLISMATSSVQDYMLSDDELLLFQQMSLYGTGVQTGTALIVLIIAIIVGVGIIAMLRFSLNVVSFDDDDSGRMGVKPNILRTVSLICSTILITAAMVHLGNVSMLSLLVPHISRYIYGSNFRDVFFSCTLLGSLSMMFCKLITYIFSFHEYLSLISTGMIINLMAAPVLIILLLQQKRGWQ